jgi:tetratricopeptide (TPR) repeat protein
LVEIASCLTFLGYNQEGWELYQRALTLNPAGRQSYYPIGAMILLELGDFSKAQELVEKTLKLSWVDIAAYFAAIYYHLGDMEQCEKYWQIYLETFSKKINGGLPSDPRDAIEWMIQVNPHRGRSNLELFWKFKTDDDFVNGLLQHQTTSTRTAQMNSFLKQEDLWELSFSGEGVQLTEVKGFHDLRKLLDNPGQPIHCAELMGATINTAQQPIIDEKARNQYQARISELQQDIQQAEMDNDLAKLGALQEEYDNLLEHLSASLGLKGKIRQAGNPIEKARSAVTWRIRNAISKIEKAHPSLGKHLSHAVNTGTFCVYEPENQVDWVLE